jgi:hypothetical protein
MFTAHLAWYFSRDPPSKPPGPAAGAQEMGDPPNSMVNGRLRLFLDRFAQHFDADYVIL